MNCRLTQMRRVSLLAITAGACLVFSGCTDSPEVGSPSPSPTSSGPMLRGVPVESFTCAALGPDRPFDYVRFESTSGLLACGSELPITGVGISATDPGVGDA